MHNEQLNRFTAQRYGYSGKPAIRLDNITLNVPSRAFSNVPFVTDSNVPLQKWLL